MGGGVGKKGFSLVELVIVIAIMAILIAILVPQFIKYVERSRQSKDETNADEILRAVEVALADEQLYTTVSASFTVVFENDATTGMGRVTFEPVGSFANLGTTANKAFLRGVANTLRLRYVDASNVLITGVTGEYEIGSLYFGDKKLTLASKLHTSQKYTIIVTIPSGATASDVVVSAAWS